MCSEEFSRAVIRHNGRRIRHHALYSASEAESRAGCSNNVPEVKETAGSYIG